MLTGKAQLKDAEVVVIGGGIVGCETAEYLAAEGLKGITIVEMLPDIAEGMEKTAQLLLQKRLKEYGVSVLTEAKVERITGEAVVLEGGKEIKADAVVIAVGRIPDNALIQSLKESAVEVYNVGDCV